MTGHIKIANKTASYRHHIYGGSGRTDEPTIDANTGAASAIFYYDDHGHRHRPKPPHDS